MIFRTAVSDDASAMADVERRCWPPKLAARASQFFARVEAFPDGQLVVEQHGRLIAVSAAQRITTEFLQSDGCTYERLTDSGRLENSHDAGGDIYQLVGVGVLPEYWGSDLARRLLDRQIKFARSLSGVRRILAFTRPARYHRFQETPIEEYVTKRNEWGRLVDPVLSFHLDAGAKLVSIHRDFRPQDHKARAYGVLIEYPCD